MKRSEFKMRLDKMYLAYRDWKHSEDDEMSEFHWNRMVKLENELYKDLFPKKKSD